MKPIDTSDPRPREQPLEYQPFRFVTGLACYLEIPTQCDPTEFWGVVAQRKTRRRFTDLDSRALGSLLWNAIKTVAELPSQNGISREHRTIPSAGGLHPVHVLVQRCEPGSHPIHYYEPHGHALREIKTDRDACVRLRDEANSVLNTESGALLWMVADFNKADAIYDNCASLVWRDVGVMIGMLCLIAEALRLSACPLGICGDEWLRGVLDLPDGIHGVGCVVVGGRNPEAD
jgi:SagB-type dehydrogenase family enzyme